MEILIPVRSRSNATTTKYHSDEGGLVMWTEAAAWMLVAMFIAWLAYSLSKVL
jgi:thiosulfate reductase cytochrome b subunit